jgi:hypothetical protein
MTSRKSDVEGLMLEAMAFGKNCRRCSVYFVTRNRTEDLCPWCMRVQSGQNHEEVTENADEPTFAGL